ncbi:Ig-like domain-containing protein [Salimicrobium flavidum]|uniref:SbsA Ig-like domain-containing protein n=1 Tax=Salimicrobium flavidum TaxID=570947 RepID=A0A1N7KTE0_9BACI|nr:Ig-like domain-containing protein [Salimicrobium flavidum]SIS64883.1 hypothetical protein SAMN05421687_1189 [Salimicrobium flavidum]
MRRILLVLMFVVPFIAFIYSVPVQAAVEADKTWTIEFNTEMSGTTLENNIWVTESDGTKLDVSIKKEGKNVYVKVPVNGYVSNSTYLLHISNELTSEAGSALQESITMDFTVGDEPESEKSVIEAEEKVDSYEPVIDLETAGISENSVSYAALKRKGEQVHKEYILENGGLRFKTTGGLQPLDLNTDYQLYIHMDNGSSHLINFTSSGFPDVPTDTDGGMVLIPAMPEKGFNYPYFLKFPSERNAANHQGKDRHLIVRPNNSGAVYNYKETLIKTRAEARGHQLTKTGDRLNLPVMTPVLPRPWFRYNEGYFTTDALDRYTVTLTDDEVEQMMNQPRIEEEMEREGFSEQTFRDIVDIEFQLEAMIDHAIEYLNDRGEGMEEKVFLTGYSSGGNFTNRWATLFPERVKAVASGAINSQPIIPKAEVEGEELIYPIGISDYENIRGKAFEMEQYNKVAKFMYQGRQDDNDTYGYSDVFGDEEERLIGEVLGEKMYPDRWEKSKELYFDSGAEGAFALYDGVGHSISPQMLEDIEEFFDANRSSDHPVYPNEEPGVEIDTGK